MKILGLFLMIVFGARAQDFYRPLDQDKNEEVCEKRRGQLDHLLGRLNERFNKKVAWDYIKPDAEDLDEEGSFFSFQDAEISADKKVITLGDPCTDPVAPAVQFFVLAHEFAHAVFDRSRDPAYGEADIGKDIDKKELHIDQQALNMLSDLGYKNKACVIQAVLTWEKEKEKGLFGELRRKGLERLKSENSRNSELDSCP